MRARRRVLAGQPLRESPGHAAAAGVEVDGRQSADEGELEDRRAVAVGEAQAHLAEAREAGEQLVDVLERVWWFEDRTPDPSAGSRSAGDLAGELPRDLAGFRGRARGDVVAAGPDEHGAGVLGQVVGQRREFVEEQRQVVLDARRHGALGDVLVDRGSDVRRRRFARGRGRRGSRRGRGGTPSRRQQPDALDAVDGAPFRVEGVQRVDLVVEEIDAEQGDAEPGKDVRRARCVAYSPCSMTVSTRR